MDGDDPFAFVRRATGRVSDSQNEIFGVDPIINLNLDPDAVLVSNDVPAAPAPAAGEPTPMCASPDNPITSAAETLGLGPSKGKSPAKSPEAPTRKLPASILYTGPEPFVPDGWLPDVVSDKGKAKAAASSPKHQNGKAAAAASSQIPPGKDDLEAVRPSSQKPSPKIGPFPNDSKAGESSSSRNAPPKPSLADVMTDFMSQTTVPGNMDILEVLAMRGTHFPNPSWWRKGGYDAKPKSPK